MDESALTGESMPLEKSVGMQVLAATVNTSGYMVCEATGVGDSTAMAGVIRMVEDASATKAPIARLADNDLKICDGRDTHALFFCMADYRTAYRMLTEHLNRCGKR